MSDTGGAHTPTQRNETIYRAGEFHANVQNNNLRFWLSHSKHLPSLAPLHSLEAIRSSCPWSPDLCSRSVQTQFSTGLSPGLMRNPMGRVGGHLFVEVGDTATGHLGGELFKCRTGFMGVQRVGS